MMRALAIQLGRVGDVIQTTPLLADLAAHGDEIDVLILRSTHAAILGCPSIKSIITVADTLKPLDDAIAFRFPHRKIPAGAFDLLADLRLPLYDRVINASHAPLGCWLAAEIPFANLDARYGGIIRDRECLYFGAASVYGGDPPGCLVYRPIHRDSLTSNELVARSLREAFATEFVGRAANTTRKRLKISAIEPASGLGSAGIPAGSLRSTCADNRQCRDDASLTQILYSMQILATLCARSARGRPAASEVAAAGQSLITIVEKLRTSAAESPWRRFSPVIHNLDSHLRMLRNLDPAATFRARAGIRLRRSHRAKRKCHPAQKPRARRYVSTRRNEFEGVAMKGRREGGQVPHSVRIQAPARQRGSVSP